MLANILLQTTFLVSAACNYWYPNPPPVDVYPKNNPDDFRRSYAIDDNYYRPYCTQQRCGVQPGQLGLDCSGFQNPYELRQAVQAYAVRGLDICTLQIRNSRLQYLAPGTFRKMNIRNLVISDNDLRSLSPPGGYHRGFYPIFDGMETSLNGLYVINNRGMKYLDLEELRPLENLTSLEIRRNNGAHLKNVAYSLKRPLERLDIEDSYMGSVLVANRYDNPSLSEVVLRRLAMDRIHREDFPNPASNLSRINLSENLLTSLPPNLFTGMPALTSLDLSSNRLRGVPESTFKPVASTLKSLNLYDNPIVCDCGLSWVLKRRANCKTTSADQGNDTAVAFEVTSPTLPEDQSKETTITSDEENTPPTNQETSTTPPLDQRIVTESSTNPEASGPLTVYLVCYEPPSLYGRTLDTLTGSDLCPNNPPDISCS